jgi:predicted AAA+ superfamily ATPase
MSGSFHAPSIDEYLNICRNYNKDCSIELKNDLTGSHANYNWTSKKDGQNYNYMILINKIINAGM